MRAAITTIALLLVARASANAVTSLTGDTYDQATAGKIVFIKFFAPWCGHCKAMAADWEKLANDYTGKDNILIAEVDCTLDENDDLCDFHGVQGFPTIKHGDPTALEEYDGGRQYDELAEFAKEELKPSCSPSNLDLCNDEEKAFITKFQAMSVEVLDDAIDEVEELLDLNEDKMDEEVEKLRDLYDEVTKKYEKQAKELSQEKGLKYMKAVLATKDEPVFEDDEPEF